MSCSDPLRLYPSDIKNNSLRPSHADYTELALIRSRNEFDWFNIPCRSCTNCRIDMANSLIDRCEYEYMDKGCGAFVTFTYNDVSVHRNSFINSHTGEYTSSISYKDGKDMLNRLNKLVHKEYKRLVKATGLKYQPLCNPDYKYVLTHEYGDKNNRPHIHALFFGLDFAICERLFWRAWQFQGNVEVGAIRNGGIAYCVKYIGFQTFGLLKRLLYKYNHLLAPRSTHSLGLGSGLYTSQLDYIKKTGSYRWHGVDKPVPTYYKNKFLVTADLTPESIENQYKRGVIEFKNLYSRDIHSFKDLMQARLEVSRIKQMNTEVLFRQHGVQLLDIPGLQRDIKALFSDGHRLPTNYDQFLCKVRRPDGTFYASYGDRCYERLKPTDLYKMNTDFNGLRRMFGDDDAYKILGMVNPNSAEEQKRLALF